MSDYNVIEDIEYTIKRNKISKTESIKFSDFVPTGLSIPFKLTKNHFITGGQLLIYLPKLELGLEWKPDVLYLTFLNNSSLEGKNIDIFEKDKRKGLFSNKRFIHNLEKGNFKEKYKYPSSEDQILKIDFDDELFVPLKSMDAKFFMSFISVLNGNDILRDSILSVPEFLRGIDDLEMPEINVEVIFDVVEIPSQIYGYISKPAFSHKVLKERLINNLDFNFQDEICKMLYKFKLKDYDIDEVMYLNEILISVNAEDSFNLMELIEGGNLTIDNTNQIFFTKDTDTIKNKYLRENGYQVYRIKFGDKNNAMSDKLVISILFNKAKLKEKYEELDKAGRKMSLLVDLYYI